MADPTNIPVAVLPKNTREELRVTLSTYNGHRFIDVRTYVDGKGDDRSPTQKGVTIKPEGVPAMIAALQAAVALNERGAGA